MILSKYQLQSTDGQYLSYQRSVAQARIIVNSRTINFFATHLDPDYSSRRQTQINELESYMSGFSESRIVAGDFNSQATTTEMTDLRSDYTDIWLEAIGDGTATAYPDNSVGSGTRTRRSLLLPGRDADDGRCQTFRNVHESLAHLTRFRTRRRDLGRGVHVRGGRSFLVFRIRSPGPS